MAWSKRPGPGAARPVAVLAWCALRTMEAGFDRERVAERVGDLAVQGVYVGTSSWNYTGWLGQLYDTPVQGRRYGVGCLEVEIGPV